MKRITITALAMALGVALFQPGFTLALDKAQKDKEQVQKAEAQAKAKASTGRRGQASKETSRSAANAVASAKVRNARKSQSTAIAERSRGSRVIQSPKVTIQNNRITRSTTRNSTRFDYRSFNRSNAYGGRWFAGHFHPDWDRNRIHYWDNHRYRWYDGGWLIVDGGFWPPDYYESYSYRPSYSYSDSMPSSARVWAVQQKLADLGYYHDSVDGIIGPRTHNAIAQYQRDSGLTVTGRIDEALLASLGVG